LVDELAGRSVQNFFGGLVSAHSNQAAAVRLAYSFSPAVNPDAPVCCRQACSADPAAAGSGRAAVTFPDCSAFPTADPEASVGSYPASWACPDALTDDPVRVLQESC
jgi:hypothetical protein